VAFPSFTTALVTICGTGGARSFPRARHPEDQGHRLRGAATLDGGDTGCPAGRWAKG